MNPTIEEISSLQQTLNASLDVIKQEILTQSLPSFSNFSLDAHPLDDPNYLGSSNLFNARKLGLASLGQLKNLIQTPYDKVKEQSFGTYETSCLDIFVHTGLVDLLIAKPTGIPLGSIGTQLKMDPRKVEPVLNFLSTQGWVYERQPGVFAPCRPAFGLKSGTYGRSWAMTTGKIEVSGALLDFMTCSQWKYSTSIKETAFQLAHNTDKSIFEFLQDHPAKFVQWSKSVKTLGDAIQNNLISDFPWESLEAETFIDCGGGQGFLSIELAKRLPNAKFVVQDLPQMVEICAANIASQLRGSFRHGTVRAESHSFFNPQPRQADVYIFRYILHDWSDEDCITILQRAIEAGHSRSRILIIDAVIRPATVNIPFPSAKQCEVEELTPPALSYHLHTDHDEHWELGSQEETPVDPPVPFFIPENFGAAEKNTLGLGVHLMGAFNARERSLAEWLHLTHSAGLTISKIHSLRANVSIIECIKDSSEEYGYEA